MIRILSTLAVLALLGACAPAKTAPSLAGSEWRPVAFGTLAVPAEVEVFVRFGAEGAVAGNGGCNSFNGSYAEAGGSLVFGPVAATRMACPDAAMAVEDALFGALAATAAARRDGASLVLLDGAGLELAVLQQSDWD